MLSLSRILANGDSEGDSICIPWVKFFVCANGNANERKCNLHAPKCIIQNSQKSLKTYMRQSPNFKIIVFASFQG
jgi:hypothetical protein